MNFERISKILIKEVEKVLGFVSEALIYQQNVNSLIYFSIHSMIDLSSG
jgi:hypothetical protein